MHTIYTLLLAKKGTIHLL